MVTGQVSIITPSYNSARYIGEAIASVIRQTYTHWEMIIVDDGSTDSSVDIVKAQMAKDSRIKLITLEHQGAAAARNAAIAQAQGQYIAFLDSDDRWEEDKLRLQTKVMQEKGYAFVFSSYAIIKEDGQRSGRIIKAPECITYHQYLRNTIIGCLTVIIDREKTGDFRMPIIRSSHDMALWLIILKRGFPAYGLPEVLADYRVVETSNTSNKWRAATDVWKVYREHEHLSLFYSLWCFVGYAYHAVLKRL